MLPGRLKRRQEGNQEIDITPFMNLMAVLTPFLLATAVFTRLAVHEIYLPPPDDSAQAELLKEDQEKPKLVLTISVTDRGIIVSNADKIVSFIGLKDDGKQNYDALSEILQGIKVNFPEDQNAIILSTPMISYGTVVKVMDSTRTWQDKESGTRQPLFPNISLGEVQ
jgi:biopolymer transport protein ExbD